MLGGKILKITIPRLSTSNALTFCELLPVVEADDEGIGVFESLKQNPIHRKYVTSNEEALRWAIQPGVSVAFNPALGQRSNDVWANSGYGLYMISEICRKTNGWFTFVSGEECLRAYPNNISICKTKFNGTA